MLSFITPENIRAPFARYSHGVCVEPGVRLLLCSGQLGVDAADRVPEAAGDQSTLCFQNIGAILREADMTPADVVRVNAYVTDRGYLQDYMRARDDFFADVRQAPASTLMIVAGFAREVCKVEVEVVAASPFAEGESQ